MVCTIFRVAANHRGFLLWMAIALALPACGFSAAAPDASKVQKHLAEYTKRCTEIHGYDPSATSALGPHTLGVGEREWRDCVYKGVEKHVIPKAFAPEAYRRAIEEDRKMTEDVAGGRMTRLERQERIQALLAEIDRREEAEAERMIKEIVRREQEMIQLRDRRSMMRPLSR